MSEDSGENTQFVYHYTDSAGLLGILSEKCLRLTNVAYLNDSEELKEGLRHYGEPATAAEEGRLKEVRKAPQYYIGSFTKHSDHLRHWMSYCPSGGYAIGFNRAKLQEHTANSSTLRYDKVKYDTEDKVTMLRRDQQGGPENLKPDEPDEVDFNDKIFDLLTCKKNEWADEHEERIIQFESDINFISDDYIKFRAKGSLLVPYTEFNFKPDMICQVIIGPMANQDLAERSLEIIKLLHFYHFSICRSQVSLRSL